MQKMEKIFDMDSMDKGLKIKFREEFIPSYIELNGLREPFKLIEHVKHIKMDINHMLRDID